MRVHAGGGPGGGARRREEREEEAEDGVADGEGDAGVGGGVERVREQAGVAGALVHAPDDVEPAGLDRDADRLLVLAVVDAPLEDVLDDGLQAGVDGVLAVRVLGAEGDVPVDRLCCTRPSDCECAM
jgi:hypothetical protein